MRTIIHRLLPILLLINMAFPSRSPGALDEPLFEYVIVEGNVAYWKSILTNVVMKFEIRTAEDLKVFESARYALTADGTVYGIPQAIKNLISRSEHQIKFSIEALRRLIAGLRSNVAPIAAAAGGFGAAARCVGAAVLTKTGLVAGGVIALVGTGIYVNANPDAQQAIANLFVSPTEFGGFTSESGTCSCSRALYRDEWGRDPMIRAPSAWSLRVPTASDCQGWIFDKYRGQYIGTPTGPGRAEDYYWKYDKCTYSAPPVAENNSPATFAFGKRSSDTDLLCDLDSSEDSEEMMSVDDGTGQSVSESGADLTREREPEPDSEKLEGVLAE